MGFQKLNKKGLEFKSAFFAVIAIGVLATAVTIMLGGWNTQYSSGIAPDLEAFDRVSSIASQAEVQQGKLSTNDPDPGTDPEANTFRGVYGVLANIFAPFRVVFGENGMLDSVTDRFGLPSYIRIAIVTMMIIAITFALVSIIFRLSRRSA